MDTSKILPGKELVARGVTKTNATLPDSGQKEITPNGTWLENKQIQSALDARRHLLEVERIEKLGSLSIAVWRHDLKLAEVIKKAGSHWQYMGHNIGKHLYLLPEEALYLIEINSLLLKHNDVIVSLQEAYRLCLAETDIAHYKVYSSLSRLGYRVFRYRDITQANTETDHQEHNKANSKEFGKSDILHTRKSGKVNEELTVVNTNTNVNNTNSGVLQNIKNTCNASNDVDEPTNSVLTKKTSEDNRKTQTVDKTEDIVDLIEDSERSEQAENRIVLYNDKALKSGKILQNMAQDVMPCQDNETRVIVLGYTSINNGNNIVEGMDVDLEANRGQTNTALNTDSATNSKVDTNNATREKGNTSQNTVIVKRKNIENIDTGESKHTKVSSKVPENKDHITNVNMATVIVNTKNIMSNTSRDNNYMEVDEDRSTCDNDSRKLHSNCADVIYSVDVSGIIRLSDPRLRTDERLEHCGGDSTSNINQDTGMDNLDLYLMHKMQKLQDRQNHTKAPQRNNKLEKISLPDCYDKKVVTAKSPHVEYLPRNIFLMKTTYLVDLEGIKRINSKNRKDSTTGSSDGDCSNEPRRLQVTGSDNRSNVPHRAQARPGHILLNPPIYPVYPTYFTPPVWGPRPPLPVFRHFMRPRHHMFRPIIPNVNYPRPGFNEPNARKQGNPRFKSYHLRVIKKLVDKFRLVFAPDHVHDLLRLVDTFNRHYRETYRLTHDFKLVHMGAVPEVIDLEDGEPEPKRPRPDDDNETINKHLESLRSLAGKLKDLETKKLATSRHRRVLSNAIKMFNKNFDADIYMNSDFEIIDSKLITLDSSSDSDSVVAVEPTKRKRLRNPFSMMKHGNGINEGASTSRGEPVLRHLSPAADLARAPPGGAALPDAPAADNEGEGLSKYFHSSWIPGDEDFGRPAVMSREEACHFDLLEAEYQHTFFKYHTGYFENWSDLKVAIMAQAQETIRARKERAMLHDAAMNDRVQPLVGADCVDTGRVLQRLRIIPPTEAVDSSPGDCAVEVDFDVYYGNSPHFRKANRPKPNFRVLCLDVSEQFLCSEDIGALCSKHGADHIPLVLGAVGTGSISYIQLNNAGLPLYVPDNFY